MSFPDDETSEHQQPDWPASDLAATPDAEEPMPPEFEAPPTPEIDVPDEAAPMSESEPQTASDLNPQPLPPQPDTASDLNPQPLPPQPDTASDLNPQPLPPQPDTASDLNPQPLPPQPDTASDLNPQPLPPQPDAGSPDTSFPAADAAAAGIGSLAHIEDSPTTQTQVPPIVAVPAAGAAQQAQPWQAQQQAGQWQQPQQPSQQQAAQPQSQWPQSQQSQWQQPQAQQQWPQQQPQQWQQPGQYPQQQYGQQPYGQPPYPPQSYQQYPAQGYQQPYYPAQQGATYSTSALVAIAGILLAIFGIVDILGGVWLLSQGNELRSFINRTTINLFGTVIDRETMRALLSPSPGVLMVFGLVELLAAVGIFAHKVWARVIGIIVALLGLLVMIAGISFAIALSPGFSMPLIGTIAVLIGYAFILVALFAGGSHFRRRTAQQ